MYLCVFITVELYISWRIGTWGRHVELTVGRLFEDGYLGLYDFEDFQEEHARSLQWDFSPLSRAKAGFHRPYFPMPFPQSRPKARWRFAQRPPMPLLFRSMPQPGCQYDQSQIWCGLKQQPMWSLLLPSIFWRNHRLWFNTSKSEFNVQESSPNPFHFACTHQMAFENSLLTDDFPNQNQIFPRSSHSFPRKGPFSGRLSVSLSMSPRMSPVVASDFDQVVATPRCICSSLHREPTEVSWNGDTAKSWSFSLGVSTT